MDIVQCKICKRPFQSFGGRTCPDCMQKIDKDFITVRDYIYENPDSGIDKVAEETKVDRAIILHLLKEGRLILDNPEAECLLVCDLCKKPISSGRFCKDCKDKVAFTMNQSLGGKKPDEPPRNDIKASKHTAKMHTSIRHK
jgi:predicted amidophosphoribosyltransferase